MGRVNTVDSRKVLPLLHVDINSYFATILEQENPALRGVPFGVVKDEGRTCLIAVSKAAKRYGIKTGERLADARLKYPAIRTVPAVFDRYLSTTQQLRELFLSISPAVYIYSLDEAFIDLTECLCYLYASPIEVAVRLQQQIKRQLGQWVTCSIGVSHTRLLAKMASETAGPDSIKVINQYNRDAVLASTTFSDVCGVGYRLSRRLARLGVTVPYQIRLLDPEVLQQQFGPFWAVQLERIAYGEDPHTLQLIDRSLPHMKSVGRSVTGFRLWKTEAEVRTVIINLVEEVTHKARRMGLAGRAVSLSLYGSEPHQRWYQHITVKTYMQHTSQVLTQITELLARWEDSFAVIKVGVRLALLAPVSQLPQSLFPEPQHQRLESISAAMDAVNERYGLFTLRSARLLDREKVLRPEVTGFLGDRTFYGL